MSFWDKKEAKWLFQEPTLPIAPIVKPRVKHLKIIDVMHEFLFYNELNIVKTSFRRFERSYKIEITGSKDPLVQLTTCNSSIKELFKDLLNEIKRIKYQITVTVLLSKYKENGT